ncbi:MAG: shikimate dehydrogenase [Microbacteriaceae bacterium]|jgi:shikimate dehydrogenase|nr:shikimate dehydrogenase [Microbacteriaceae bacterium]
MTGSRGAGMSSHMGFVGVSTSQSSIMSIFPTWADILGLPTRTLIGHDLPMDASPADYRRLVEHIRDDPDHLGALVTTHKMGIFAAAHDLFDDLDDFSTLCGEISSISKRNGRLVGHAKDPITVGLAAEEFLAPDHFARTGAGTICFGAGGAGTALTWYLAGRPDTPNGIIVTDTSQPRLDHLREVHNRRGTPGDLIRYVRADDSPAIARALAAGRAGTFVVNASGLGKDRPGNPMPDGTHFPEQSSVWEFNYRGSREFLAQARDEELASGLEVFDGWRYFIHGWSQVIAEVFGVDITEALVTRLSHAALGTR